MGDTVTTIIVIFLAGVLMFVFPLAAISEMNDSEALAMVQSYTTEFANQIMGTGEITKDNYDSFVQKLNATGNSYEIEMKAHIADTNPSKKTGNQAIDGTSYYVVYTSEIMKQLEETGSFPLKEGDYIEIYVKNTNTTMSQMFKIVLYNLTGDQSYVISAQASGLVYATGY